MPVEVLLYTVPQVYAMVFARAWEYTQQQEEQNRWSVYWRASMDLFRRSLWPAAVGHFSEGGVRGARRLLGPAFLIGFLGLDLLLLMLVTMLIARLLM